MSVTPLYRITVKQYDRMVEAGILGKRDRVELIEGFLVAKMERSRPHIQREKGLHILARCFCPAITPPRETPSWFPSGANPSRICP